MLACALVWLIEAGWILVLADSRVAAVWLVLTILFHVLVFLLTGLFAWQFVVMHLVMLVWVLPQAGPAGIFGWQQTGAVAVATLMAGALVGLLRRRALQECRENARPGWSIGWLDAADLLMAWWDGPCMRMYSWQGETRDGRRVSIPVTALSPHDTILTDIQTHLMVLGMHNNLDPRTASDRTIARTGVWGLLVDSRERDHLYRLADGGESKPPDLNARETVVPRSYGLTEMVPPEIEALRGLFLGISAHLSSPLFRTVMRWPHFPGEDWVPDVCPLGGVLPRWRLDVPLASVSLVRVRTFQHRDGFGLLEYEVVWTMSLE